MFSADGTKSSIEMRCDNIYDLAAMISNLAEYCNIPDLQT